MPHRQYSWQRNDGMLVYGERARCVSNRHSEPLPPLVFIPARPPPRACLQRPTSIAAIARKRLLVSGR